MVQNERVRLPPVWELLRLVKKDRVRVGELGEQTLRAGPADNDAGLPVTRQHDAHAPRLKMEGSRVSTSGERVPNKDDFVLAPLDLVRCGHDERVGMNPELTEC